MIVPKVLLVAALVSPSLASLRGAEQESLRAQRRLQDGTCSNGVPGLEGSNENGTVCCPLGCGECGGLDCNKSGRPTYSNKDCCINGVLNNQPDCTVTSAAPCIITEDDPSTPAPDAATPAPMDDPTPAPVDDPTPVPVAEGETCSNGFPGIDGSNENGAVCCPLGCGQCGDVGCGTSGKPTYDNTDCCINGVLNNQPFCADTTAAPCKFGEPSTPAPDATTPAPMDDPTPAPVDDPTPAPVDDPTPAPVAEGGTCSNGFPGIDGSNENGAVCCPLGCGQCGDVGCGTSGKPTYDNTDCCINGVLNNQPFCADTTAAPCKFGEPSTPAPDAVTPAPMDDPTPAPVDDPTPAPVDDPTPAPVPEGGTCSNGFPGIEGSNENGVVCCPLGCGQCGDVGCANAGKPTYDNTDCCINGVLNNHSLCSATTAAPCVLGDTVPTPAPATPSPVSPGSTPGPVPSGGDPCDPNPCQNGGSCALDPGGGRICTCASGYGGMDCQTDTTGLNEFSINITFTKANNVPDEDDWTPEDEDDMRRFAARWENVITHVPCGDGVLEMEIEWVKSFQVNPPTVRPGCPADKQISISGHLQNSRGLQAWKRSDNVWEEFVTHEMGHAVGIGYLWGKCTDCIINGTPPLDAKWDADACPSVYKTWLDLADMPWGTEADIIETDVSGTTGECVHWDFDAIPAELNTKGTFHRDNPNGEVFMSKLTLAALEDIGYVVDPSKADPFSLP